VVVKSGHALSLFLCPVVPCKMYQTFSSVKTYVQTKATPAMCIPLPWTPKSIFILFPFLESPWESPYEYASPFLAFFPLGEGVSFNGSEDQAVFSFLLDNPFPNLPCVPIHRFFFHHLQINPCRILILPPLNPHCAKSLALSCRSPPVGHLRPLPFSASPPRFTQSRFPQHRLLR